MLPDPHARWIDELLGAPIPDETEATCDDCAMCGEEADPGGADYSFDPHVKCCSYTPDLVNFLVGAILDDAEAPARSVVVAKVAAGTDVSPLGVGRAEDYARLYRRIAPETFGRSLELRCPYFIDSEAGGSCGIWRHRGSVCSTWFCKHVRGAVGLTFWRGLQRLLRQFETRLAKIVAREHGVRGATWGAWAGREEAFFRSCAASVRGWSLEDVLARCGRETRASARRVRVAYARLTSDDRPSRLRVGHYEIVRQDEDVTRLWSYSPNDPLEIPTEVVRSIHRFDGRTTKNVLAEIAREDGLDITDVVPQLSDFGLLIPASRLVTRRSSSACPAGSSSGPSPSSRGSGRRP